MGPFRAIFTLFIGIGRRAQAFPPLSCWHWAGAQAWSNSLASAPAVSHQAGKGLRGTARAAAEGQRADPRQVPWWCQSWMGSVLLPTPSATPPQSVLSTPRQDSITGSTPHSVATLTSFRSSAVDDGSTADAGAADEVAAARPRESQRLQRGASAWRPTLLHLCPQASEVTQPTGTLQRTGHSKRNSTPAGLAPQ